MEPEQHIRAVAAQAAASLVERGVPPLDFLVACDVVASYVRDGRDAAIATYLQSGPAETEGSQGNTLQDVNLLESAPAPSTPMAASTNPAAPLLTSVPAARSKPVEETQADVLPAAVSAPVPPKQRAALAIVEKTRRDRAQKIANEATLAKAKAHKDRLLGDMQDANLEDVSVMLEGWSEPKTLGSYLASLYGS